MKQDKKFYGWILVGVLWFIYLVNMGFPQYGASVVIAQMATTLNRD